MKKIKELMEEVLETAEKHRDSEFDMVGEIVSNVGYSIEENITEDFLYDFENKSSDAIFEVADSSVPVYYSDQLKWLSEDKNAFHFMGEAMEEGDSGDDFGKLLMAGRFKALESFIGEACYKFLKALEEYQSVMEEEEEGEEEKEK